MTEATPTLPAPSLLRWILLAAILLLTAAAYSSVASADLISLDDITYTQHPRIKSGLSPGNIFWAFTHPHAGFYIPLTWLSLQFDATLFNSPAASHIHNLLLHLLNVILVFLILAKIFPGKTLAIAAGAALWALHPLRVESVAWITERKDVLSGLFGFLAIYLYLHTIQKSPRRALLLATLAMGLATLAKPMFVTLPLLLLLLDHWPLNRLSLPTASSPPAPIGNWKLEIGNFSFRPLLRRVLEKWPLFLISILGSVLTTIAHIRNNTNMDFPLSLRLANAPISYIRYLYKHVDLNHLGLLYPLPPSWPLPLALGAVALLLAITVATVLLRRRAPWLLIGWLFFVIAFLPMIGLVQAWIQALADRFTYLPALGLSLILAGLLARLDSPSGAGAPTGISLKRLSLGALTATLSLTLAYFTYRQTLLWNNSIPLYRHTLAIERSPFLHDLLASALWHRATTAPPADRPAFLDEAESQYRLALELDPQNAGATLSLARLHLARGNLDSALALATRATTLDPNYAAAHYHLAQILHKLDRPEESSTALRRAAQLDPAYRKSPSLTVP